MPHSEDEYSEEKPRRRRRPDEEKDEDRPVRKRRREAELSGLDGTFANTNIVMLILFGMCLSGIAFILGLVGIIVCKDETAKRNAIIVTAISGVVQLLIVIMIVVSKVAGG